MRLFGIPTVVASLYGLSLLVGLDVPAAYADFTFGEPETVGAVVNSQGFQECPCLSADGLELYFD